MLYRKPHHESAQTHDEHGARSTGHGDEHGLPAAVQPVWRDGRGTQPGPQPQLPARGQHGHGGPPASSAASSISLRWHVPPRGKPQPRDGDASAASLPRQHGHDARSGSTRLFVCLFVCLLSGSLISTGYPQSRPMMSSNYGGHHNMGVMGGGGGGYNPHFNQPPMMGAGQGGGMPPPPPHGSMMRPHMMQNPMRGPVMGPRQGEPK